MNDFTVRVFVSGNSMFHFEVGEPPDGAAHDFFNQEKYDGSHPPTVTHLSVHLSPSASDPVPTPPFAPPFVRATLSDGTGAEVLIGPGDGWLFTGDGLS